MTFVEIVALVDGFAVEIYAVIDDMEMRRGCFKVAHYYILRVLYAHSFHIFLRQLRHEIIRQAWSVSLVETHGYMSDRLADSLVEARPDVETVHNSAEVAAENAVGIYQPPCVVGVLFLVVEFTHNIAHNVGCGSLCEYFSYHNNVEFWIFNLPRMAKIPSRHASAFRLVEGHALA